MTWPFQLKSFLSLFIFTTVGLVDTDCNSNMMTFPNLVKSAINLGQKKCTEDIAAATARDNEPVTNAMPMEWHKH